MAEALPRYRKAGVLLADMPRLDFASGRETARSTAALSERLDQLSTWALGEAIDRAKEEGLQYGAENPVTVRQLQDAETAARSPEELFQKRGTVFGNAARGEQVAALTIDVELEAQQRLNLLKLGVERNEIGLDEARSEIQALLDGSGAALAKIDPKAARKLRASLGTLGNSAFLSITQTYLKREDERRKVRLDSWLTDVVPDAVRAHFDAGDTRDPETGQIITAWKRIEATLHSAMAEQLADIGDPEFGRQAAKRFNDTVSRARVNAVSSFVSRDEFMRDPSASLARIRNGDLGQYSTTYRTMPADEQERVRQNFMEEAGRIHTFAERGVKDAESAAKKDVYGLLARYWTMPEGSGKAAARNDIVSRGRGVLSFDQLKALLKPAGDGEKENVQAEMHAIDLVRRGGVTDLAELQRRVPKLQAKQLKRLQDSIYDAGDRQLRETVRNLAGIPDGLVQMSGDQQRRYAALTAELDRIKAEEIEKNGKAGLPGMYNPGTVIAKLRDAKERVTADKAVDAAKATLQAYGGGKRVTLTENTGEAELRMLKFTPMEIREIQRQQRIIRGD